MKSLLSLLLFLSLPVLAQQRTIFKIDSLPANGILLDKNWKWHAGDNPDWAKADFDDSTWESIDPTLVIPELKSKLSNQPLWLRLKFKSSTTKNNLFISVKQSGATEIYLNNHLIHAFGMIDTSNDKTKSYDPNGGYISLPIDTTENILAIKYYFEKGVRYKSVFDVSYPLFSARIFSEKAVLEADKNKNAFIWEGFNLGFPLILFVVHFIIFLFYMPFRANLWYSLWALFTFISAYFLFQIKIEHNIALKNDYSLYAAILGGLGNLSLIYSLFLLLRQNNKRLLGIFFCITILSIFSFLSESKLNSIIDFSFGPIFVLLVIYMAHSAYKQGNIGGKYVIYSMVLYLITWVLFILSFDIFLNNEWISGILFHIAIFCLPMTMSILLGIDFRNIHKNFIDVTLEKQQILTTQNETLEKQVKERTAELVASQNQLIQKEKLASLGELTAGIAHEIQNPLNFVNNFSEMSVELAQELKEEAEKPEIDKELIIDLASDLAQNQQKINHHGKRASSIVSGMLEHSRTSTGERMMTDINKLADEYLRLSYHGMRAKYKDFNADYELISDANLPLINAVPQDMGRVLLNLINNAFYAVNVGEVQNLADVKKVIVTTGHTTGGEPHNQLIIKVIDNGTGISEATKAKIFQPFFTTKPTGEGTGLGLSLSYDIVTKGHGGTIEVESIEGQGTTFIVTLPLEIS